MSSLLDTIRAAAEPYGLNLVAATPVERYEASIEKGVRTNELAPFARSIVVVGNGGGAFWAAFKRHVERNPGWLQREHPLDDFTHEIVESSIAASVRATGAQCFIVYPFIQEARTLNFVQLARTAGLTGPSIIGISLHPDFGPWIAFRAALLVDDLIDSPGPATQFDPCPTCAARTCIKACPVSAVSIEHHWDMAKCLRHRVEVEQDCINRCHARTACIVGPEHIYPDDELTYHQTRTLRAIRSWYGVNITKVKPSK
jgi:epoxyqueuosine reductase